MDNIKKSSNKSFGIVFFIVFILIAFYPLLNREEIRLWALVTAMVFLVLGIKNSILLLPLNSIWNSLGFFLGKFVSPLIMGIVYFAVVFPTYLLVSIFKRNYLNIKYEKNKKTYWVDVKNKYNSMNDQF